MTYIPDSTESYNPIPIIKQFEDSIAPNIVYSFKDQFDKELFYLNAGLNEEAGEVSGKIKKYMRGDYNLKELEPTGLDPSYSHITKFNKESASRREQVAYELGDTLWYLTRMAHLLGYTLEQIMQMNMRKLEGRRTAGTIRGDGDNR